MKKYNKKLLIIDGNALIHRSFHALPPTLRTRDGILVNAVYGFTSFLIKALSEFKPQYVILTLDKAGPTFRHEVYTEYKATRVKAADELYEQIPIVKEVAKAFSIPIFEKSGFEADDIIGSLTRQADLKKDVESIIVTGDMDTLQLVSDQTKVYTMSRGLSDSVLYDAKRVEERYQLTPEQIIDFKALAGDPSDNIPGAKGIGIKTATDLLLSHQSIEGIYAALEKKPEEFKPRTLKLLQESKDNVFLSKQLATIDCNAPIELSLDDASFSLPDLNPIFELFKKLEFKSLLTKIRDIKEGWNQAAEGKKEDKTKTETSKEKVEKKELVSKNYKYLKTNTEIESFLKKVEKEKEITLHVELKSQTEEVIGFAFTLSDKSSSFIAFDDKSIKGIKDILENENIKKIGYDFKPSLKALKKINIDLKGLYFDVLLAAYLLSPGDRRYQLENLAFSELGIDSLTSEKKKGAKAVQLALDFEIDFEALTTRTCELTSLCHQLRPSLEKKLKSEDLWNIFQDVDMPLLSTLAKMEHFGIKVDENILIRLEKDVAKKIEALETKIYKLAGKEFNVNSTKQLKEILFTDLEISTKGIKKTKTGFSTAEDELNKLKDEHPIIPLLQDYRELSKIETTYLKALPKMINEKTGRIHTHFNQVIAATGRLSSHDPNLQNIPTKTKEGRKIREAFVADKGYVLVGFDYSQIELRLAAHFSHDKIMLSAFQEEIDIHTQTAALINEVTKEEVTKKMRSAAKAVNFGILYGQGPHGLSQGAGIPYSQAQEFIKKYFATYPKIKEMMDNFIKDAEELGYVSTLIGRKRYLPDINSSLPLARKASQRMAINTPLQGTAADIIKTAMIKINQYLVGKEDEIKLLLQVHDELIFEIKEDKVEKYSPEIIKIMQEGANLDVPLVVERSNGKSWENLK